MTSLLLISGYWLRKRRMNAMFEGDLSSNRSGNKGHVATFLELIK